MRTGHCSSMASGEGGKGFDVESFRANRYPMTQGDMSGQSSNSEIEQAISRIERVVCGWVTEHRVDEGASFIRGLGVELFTSKGDVRQSNQDLVAFVRIPVQRCVRASICAAVLADGIGGMADGEGASALAVSAFIAFLAAGNAPGGMKKLLLAAMQYANRRVNETYGGQGGTTLTSVLYGKQGVTGIHVGDSRIYALREASAVRLTVDDTLAEQLRQVRGEALTDDPSARDNRLVQFVGMGPNLEPHVVDLTAPDDGQLFKSFVLSTDGAHYIGDELISQMVAAGLEASRLSSQLVSLSRACGSTDNASLVVLPSKIPVNFDVDASVALLLDMPGNSLRILVEDFHEPPGGSPNEQVMQALEPAENSALTMASPTAPEPKAQAKKARGKGRRRVAVKSTLGEQGQVILGFADDQRQETSSPEERGEDKDKNERGDLK